MQKISRVKLKMISSKKILAGEIVNENYFGVIREIDDDDDRTMSQSG